MKLSSFLVLHLYKFLTALLAPLAVLFICYKKRHDKGYGLSVFNFLGFYKGKKKDCIWFHAASVGEVNSIKPLVSRFAKKNPSLNIVISTMTSTGKEAASALKAYKNISVVTAPLDAPYALCGFFRTFSPKILIIVDTELWPNMLDKASKKDIPIVIINGRLQDKNVDSYKKHANIVKDLIASKLNLVLAMSHADKMRFENIGVLKEKVIAAGNLKYDLLPNQVLFERAKAIKSKLLGNNVIGAISFHLGEEKQIINAFLAAKNKVDNLKLVLVGRHSEDCNKAVEYLKQLNVTYKRKSKISSSDELKGLDKDVIIGDTLGEIEFYFGLCDVIFMGGSFVNIGGHNPLEPAYFSLPIITGPIYHNFSEQFEKLIDNGGAFLAEDETHLAAFFEKLTKDKELARLAGVKALDIQQQGRGTHSFTLETIGKLLK